MDAKNKKEAMNLNEDARLAYELAVGKRVSDNHWWRTRKLLQRHNLEISVKNVQFLAELRQKVPKTAVGVAGLLDAYHKVDELLKRARGALKGSDVVRILSQFGISAHQSTISRWFKKSAGGFNRNREYRPEELRDILINAFLYKASHSTKLPEAN